MKKRKRIDKISLRAPATILWLLITALVVNLSSCETEASIEDYMVKHDAIYDPTQPVTITSFSPEGGPVGAQLIIKGTNFGSDPSIIKVTIDDVNMPVVNATGTLVYAILGTVLDENDEKGVLTVYVGEGEQQQKVVAEKLFKFRNEPYVTTLAGFRDEEGNSSSFDGKDITETQFHDLCRVYLDKDNNLFVLEETAGIRFIPNDHTKTKTLFNITGEIRRMWSLSFAPDYSRIILTNYRDYTDWTNRPGFFELPYTDDPEKGPYDGSQFKTLTDVGRCDGGAFHPFDNVYFYTSRTDGKVMKWYGVSDPIRGDEIKYIKDDEGNIIETIYNSKELFKTKEKDAQIGIYFEPTKGEYAYIILTNQNQILKSRYNKEKQELEPATVFVGTSSGKYEDGVGTGARFNTPHQGCFDEEENFYVADAGNNVIRKITPNGIVTTLVGVAGSDGAGNVDGTFTDARLSNPQGIAYDKERKVFYVADRGNRAVRMIVLPHE